MESIYVAGHTGLLGSALVRRFAQRPGIRLITAVRDELELTDPSAVEGFLNSARPDAVIVAAGRVGGIAANAEEPVEFLYENLMIETNLIHGAWKAGVRRLVNFGSSCMYPRETPQPMRPEQLMTGPLEPTSEPYAVAKWAGMALCASLQRQHGVRFITAIPATLYGPGDHFDPKRGHVLSALIAKFHEAKEQSSPEVTLWGTGSARREFLYADDAAEAVDLLLERGQGTAPINVGPGEAISIRDLAAQAAQVVGFRGRVLWDPTRPDGAPEKRLDSTMIRRLGWAPRTDLAAGLRKSYEWFLERALCKSS